jgi:hypothetical protein
VQTTSLRCADGRQLVVNVDAPAQLPDLAAVEVVAYRAAVEALTTWLARPRQPGRPPPPRRRWPLLLTVHNSADGVGDAWTPGVGITSMHERVGQIGGTLIIDRSMDGTTVTTEFPLSLLDEKRPDQAVTI